MRLPPARFIAVAFALAALLKTWPVAPLMEAVAVVDGAGLVLIWFARDIDDATFGSSSKGGQIDVHTPPWMIAGFGWLLLFLITWIIFFHHTTQ